MTPGFDEIDAFISLAHKSVRLWQRRKDIANSRFAATLLRVCHRSGQAAVPKLAAHYRANRPFWRFAAVYGIWTAGWYALQGAGSSVNDVTFAAIVLLTWATVACWGVRWTVRRVKNWL